MRDEQAVAVCTVIIVAIVGAFAPPLRGWLMAPGGETDLEMLCVKYAARHSTTPERACQKL